MPASNSFPLWSENLVPGGQQSPVRLRSRQKMTLLQKAPQNRAPNRWTTFVCLVVVVLLFSGCGDRKPKVYRVGILSGVEAFAGVADGFRSKMAELGYIEGQNILYDVEKLNADPVGEKRVARKFVTDKVDMIFAFPTEPAVAAKEATQGTNIPVVFANAGLEGTNLIRSVREPGGNITGVRFPGPDATLKRFEFLLELVPHAKRVYITYDRNYPNNAPAMEVLRSSGRSKGVTLVEVAVTSLEEIQAGLRALPASGDTGIDAMLIMPELLTQSPAGWAVITKFASERRVPIGGAANYTAEHGAVFAYAPDPIDLGKLAAPLADKIFKGIPAGTIPVVTPENHLHLNYKLAQELGLRVSEGLLKQATQIIR
jgi:putative ABC transport system substrate-binding protein